MHKFFSFSSSHSRANLVMDVNNIIKAPDRIDGHRVERGNLRK